MLLRFQNVHSLSVITAEWAWNMIGLLHPHWLISEVTVSETRKALVVFLRYLEVVINLNISFCTYYFSVSG
jgi:hypothetical protein